MLGIIRFVWLEDDIQNHQSTISIKELYIWITLSVFSCLQKYKTISTKSDHLAAVVRTDPTWSLLWSPGICIRRDVTAARLSEVASTLMAVRGKESELCWGSRSSWTELVWSSEATVCLPSQSFLAFFLRVAGELELGLPPPVQNLVLGSSLLSIITSCWANGLWAMMVISAACRRLALRISTEILNFQATTQKERKRKKHEKNTEKNTKRSMWS